MGFKLGLVSAAVLAIGMPPVVAQPTPAEGEPGMLPPVFKKAPPRLSAGPMRPAFKKAPPRLSAGPLPCRSCSAGNFEYDANTLQFGTGRWRDQMRRENRLGNPG
jgi:hypothetical protein